MLDLERAQMAALHLGQQAGTKHKQYRLLAWLAVYSDYDDDDDGWMDGLMEPIEAHWELAGERCLARY